jgi:hypothetical protein
VCSITCLAGGHPDHDARLWGAGNSLQLGKPGKMYEAMTRWAKHHGPVYKMFLGRRACIVVSGERSCRHLVHGTSW